MVGCLYIPSFPTWTFMQVEEERGPLVVLASGKVIAADRAARRAGVESGMTGERARSLCPDVRLRVRDAALEAAAWEDVLVRLHDVTPFMEAEHPPFAFFRTDELPAARALTGTLSAQSGIAPDRPTAQLAALRAAPGNTLVLSRRVVKSFLDRFDVERLAELDFEEDTTVLLRHFGYGTLGAARALSRRHLKAQFGEDGERLFEMLHPSGRQSVPLFQEPRVVRVDYDFDDPCREPGEVLPVLEHLVRRAAVRLRSEYCQRVRLTLRGYRAPAVLACRILPEPVGNVGALMRAAGRLLLEAISPVIEIEGVMLELGALRHIRSAQVPLFRERPSVYSAVRAVHRRFPETVKRAVVQPYVLFSEDEMRLDPFPEAPAGRRRGPG